MQVQKLVAIVVVMLMSIANDNGEVQALPISSQDFKFTREVMKPINRQGRRLVLGDDSSYQRRSDTEQNDEGQAIYEFERPDMIRVGRRHPDGRRVMDPYTILQVKAQSSSQKESNWFKNIKQKVSKIVRTKQEDRTVKNLAREHYKNKE